MYEAFYGFTENPFSDMPDPQYFYPGKLHTSALSQLEYSLTSQIGFSVITGEAGTGKTLLIRSLLNNSKGNIIFGLVSSAYQPLDNIIQWILTAFDLYPDSDEKPSQQKLFTEYLITQYAQGNRCVLIIDEAQELSAESLEELRMLSNINADKDQIFQVILVGQQALRDTLRRSDMQQFAQRVAIDNHLRPLTMEETASYIHHRCTIAGQDKHIFSDQSCEQIFTASQGIPRLINTLCNTALIYGYAAQTETIDGDLMREVISDKQQGGLSGLQSNFDNSTPVIHDKAPIPTIAVKSNNPELADNIQSLLANFNLNVISSATSDDIGQDLPAADALILETSSTATEIQPLLQNWQRPILFIEEMNAYKDLKKTEKYALSQSLHNKLTSLLATQ